MALPARLLCWLALGFASASLPLPTLPPLPPLPSLPLPAIPPASQPQPRPAPRPSVQLAPAPALPVPVDLPSLAAADSDYSLPNGQSVDDLGPRSSSRYRSGTATAGGSRRITAAAFSAAEPMAASPRPAACPVLGFPTSNSSCPQIQ